MDNEVEMVDVRCAYCKHTYQVVKGYEHIDACLDCFYKYYNINVDGTITKKKEPWLGNDTSYKDKPRFAYQPGKGYPKGEKGHE